MSLSGTRILVTGASSGLGRAVAVQLAQAGATVLVTARREDRLLELAKAHPTIEPHILDVTDADAVDAFAKQVGALDGAILNAGITEVGLFADGSFDRDHSLIATNITANVRLARVLEPALGSGRLVIVGSLAGLVPLPYQAVYSGTKAFVNNFALALREEWSGRISVGVFTPGGIKTEMTDIDAMAHLEKHLADIETVAAELLRFYRSTRAVGVPGASNRLMSAVSRLIPRPLLARLMERSYRR